VGVEEEENDYYVLSSPLEVKSVLDFYLDFAAAWASGRVGSTSRSNRSVVIDKRYYSFLYFAA
jgi:hypothetical protein